MSNRISHEGIIDSISSGMVRVRITQNSACSSCKIASHCTSAESKEKLIDVHCNNTGNYSVGQEVMVMAAESVGMKAVLIAFVIPTVILLAVISTCIINGLSELTAAISGLATLIPYYTILYICRKRLEKSLTFWIE
ncbi:MAG: SoxR reducing system RseC family protein [Prevotella sp.]|nr:SoxR reducing system RseC family protein [Candidatus Prevotella equi]